MSREILFKAKRLDNGKWVEGFYVRLKGSTHHYIFTGILDITGLYPTWDRFEIDPSTLCQHTGLMDMNGMEMWENDSIEFMGKIGTVVLEDGCFGIGFNDYIDWDEIEEEVLKITGINSSHFCMNDNFISFWEIMWNFDEVENMCCMVKVIDNPELQEV